VILASNSVPPPLGPEKPPAGMIVISKALSDISYESLLVMYAQGDEEEEEEGTPFG
jgi:hypothetical protein